MVPFRAGRARLGSRLVWSGLASALLIGAPAAAQAGTDEAAGPTFRKGLWHFVRTLDLVIGSNSRQRLMEREMTRCVDPTLAMKATFSAASIGSCVSDKAHKAGNRYTFTHRCDYMGPVSTVITVQGDDSYSELNELTVGKLPRSELVVARRIGDCHDEAASAR